MPTHSKKEIDFALAKRIKEGRRRQGLTLQQLADELEVSKVAVWSWENAKTRPRRANLERLRKALNIPLEALLVATEPEPAPLGVISDCRVRIADAIGVGVDDVEIKIRIGALAA